MKVHNTQNGTTVIAYQGDAVTLLAFDVTDNRITPNFVGFTVTFKNPLGQIFPIMNKLGFVAATEAQLNFQSSVDAPLQTFHWVHVPGTFHGDLAHPAYGDYSYTVTPRYFDTQNNKLQPLDNTLSASVTSVVKPFEKGATQIGFTRGYMVSQAYLMHFGDSSELLPQMGNLAQNLQADLSTKIPTSPKGFTYNDQHKWMGFNAFEKILTFLDEVAQNPQLSLDVFGYDFNLPEVINRILALADQNQRVRIILDDSKTHSDGSKENDFEQMFVQKAGQVAIQRGHFTRLAHDKIFIQKLNGKPIKVLTGSTNFALNGVFVNANHVVVFNDTDVAQKYADVFDACFTPEGRSSFSKNPLANQKTVFQKPNLPKISITFSPHAKTSAVGITASSLLDEISNNITNSNTKSVFFAVMQLNGGGTLISTLNGIQTNPNVFSYGITDESSAIHLYHPGENTGILISGKPAVGNKLYPPPFNKEVTFMGHEIHHKFVVLNFNTPDAKVYCGSSNFSLGGEQENGDNLILFEDEDITTVFAIEAMRLIEHYEFRNKIAQSTNPLTPLSLKKTFPEWGATYSNPNDYHFRRRKLFATTDTPI